MIKNLLCGLLLLPFLVSCMPDTEKNTIVVDGTGYVEKEPERFSVEGVIRKRSNTQAVALAELANILDEIRTELPALEGLERLTIETDEVTLKPIQDAECLETRRYSTEDECPAVAYFASLSLDVSGAPAALAGNTLSLVSELGAEEVGISSYSLVDVDTARAEALEKAVLNARGKAETIAAGLNRGIAGVARVQQGNGFSGNVNDNFFFGGRNRDDEIVVTASRTPETELTLEPRPIRISASVVAAFEVE